MSAATPLPAVWTKKDVVEAAKKHAPRRRMMRADTDRLGPEFSLSHHLGIAPEEGRRVLDRLNEVLKMKGALPPWVVRKFIPRPPPLPGTSDQGTWVYFDPFMPTVPASLTYSENPFPPPHPPPARLALSTDTRNFPDRPRALCLQPHRSKMNSQTYGSQAGRPWTRRVKLRSMRRSALTRTVYLGSRPQGGEEK